MFTLLNERTGQTEGNFDTWAEAAEASQNYSPDWRVHEIGA